LARKSWLEGDRGPESMKFGGEEGGGNDYPDKQFVVVGREGANVWLAERKRATGTFARERPMTAEIEDSSPWSCRGKYSRK